MSQVDLTGNAVENLPSQYCPVDSPASRSVVPGSDKARKMTVSSGLKCSALLRSSNHLGLLEKTCLGSSQWHSTIVLLAWKISATPAGRSIFQLVPSVPFIEEQESSLLPTVTTQEVEPPEMELSENGRRLTKNNQNSHSINLADRLLMTPSATNIEGGSDRTEKRTKYRESIGRHYVPGGLAEQIKMLPPLRANDNDQGNHEAILKAGSSWKGQKRGSTVATAIAMLPTCTARDYKDTGQNTNYRKLSEKCILSGRIAMLPTVTTPRPHDSEKTAGEYIPSQNQVDLTVILGKNNGLKLQPAFAEWMMGFPEGWTALNASEMPLSRSKSIRSSKRLQTLKGGAEV